MFPLRVRVSVVSGKAALALSGVPIYGKLDCPWAEKVRGIMVS